MSEIPKSKVRAYTEVERKAMAFEPGIPPAYKAARLINSHLIDVDRYQEAMVKHPDHRDHFGRQIRASHEYYGAMLGFMIVDGLIEPADYPEIQVSRTVPYDGTESPISVVFVETTPQDRAGLVA